jgi:hypothetical protein
MSKSPLSGAFSGSSEPAKKKNKKNGAILLIAGVALASSIGGVFAATSSIELNGDAAIEFGQGIAAVDVCSSTADVSMSQVFTSDEFYVDIVTVTFNAGCDTKQATVTLIDSLGVPIENGTFTATVSSNAVSNDFESVSIVAANVDDVTVTTAD